MPRGVAKKKKKEMQIPDRVCTLSEELLEL